MIVIPASFHPWFRRYAALPALLVLLLQLWLPPVVGGNSGSAQQHELQPAQVASPLAGPLAALEESRDIIDKYFFGAALVWKKPLPCPVTSFFSEDPLSTPGKMLRSFPVLSRPPPSFPIYSAGFQTSWKSVYNLQ